MNVVVPHPLTCTCLTCWQKRSAQPIEPAADDRIRMGEKPSLTHSPFAVLATLRTIEAFDGDRGPRQ